MPAHARREVWPAIRFAKSALSLVECGEIHLHLLFVTHQSLSTSDRRAA
jgi:hypothetical protein